MQTFYNLSNLLMAFHMSHIYHQVTILANKTQLKTDTMNNDTMV